MGNEEINKIKYNKILSLYKMFKIIMWLLQLQESLLMFPGLLLPLLDKCGISPDKEVTSHNFFGTSEQLGLVVFVVDVFSLPILILIACLYFSLAVSVI